MPQIDEKVRDRFFAKVRLGGFDECWVWQAARCSQGYGRFGLAGKNRRAHRVSYMIHVGEIPVGIDVLHSCDNPPCVNPAHLRLGTDRDNVADMKIRGRERKATGAASGAHTCRSSNFFVSTGQSGERNLQAKLTEERVKLMRRLRSEGASLNDLAERFGVTFQAVSRVCRRKTWAHVA